MQHKKFMRRILNKRLNHMTGNKIGEEQMGFRISRSTTDTMVVQLLTKKCHNYSEKTQLTFVYLRKAYHKTVMMVMEKR